MTRALAALAFALAGALACSRAPATFPPSAPSPLLDGQLPDLRGVTLAGERLDPRTVRGRPVVVKFFAEYCEPCKRTLPAVERLAKEHGDVAFVGVSEDEHASTARAVAERYGLTFVVVHDRDRVLGGRFRVNELPVTFVADRSGKVRWVGGPAQTEADLAQAIDALR